MLKHIRLDLKHKSYISEKKFLLFENIIKWSQAWLVMVIIIIHVATVTTVLMKRLPQC